MYQAGDIRGNSLPDHTLCLTFDDGPGSTSGAGPGPRTLELAQYVNDQGVPATFFMVGKFASDLPDIMSRLKSLGHLIGNHTYDHANLVDYAAEGGDVVMQVAKTDGVIRNWVDAPVVLVRPPYGSWAPEIARALNANLSVTLSHAGPINWDIGGSDWACWKNGTAPKDCLAEYLEQIDAHGRGIVLMHDCTADMDVVRSENRTLELVQLLIPALAQRDYRFARVDAVPDIVALGQNTVRLALEGCNGLYVSAQAGGGGAILVNGRAIGSWERLVIEDLHVGKVALRATTGHYISPQGGGGGAVLANGPAIGDWEPLDLISLGGNQVAFRTVTGHFLACDTSEGVINANASSWQNMQRKNVFTYEFLP